MGTRPPPDLWPWSWPRLTRGAAPPTPQAVGSSGGGCCLPHPRWTGAPVRAVGVDGGLSLLSSLGLGGTSR